MAIAAIATLAAVAGCGGGDASRPIVLSNMDPGDSSVAQGVEIVDGRFVPELIAVDHNRFRGTSIGCIQLGQDDMGKPAVFHKGVLSLD